MSSIVSWQTYQITCLSPIHVGSGDAAANGIDYDWSAADKATLIFDPDRLFDHVTDLDRFARWLVGEEQSRPQSPSSFQPATPRGRRRGEARQPAGPSRSTPRASAGRRSIMTYFRDVEGRGEIPPKAVLYQVPERIEAKNIRRCIRSARGHPLLPGSSVKGSLRTVVLLAAAGEGGTAGPKPRNNKARNAYANALQQGQRKGKNPGRAAQPIEGSLLRSSHGALAGDQPARDPKGDILRALRVGDATFGPVTVRRARVYSLKHNGSLKPKAYEIAVEVIPEQASTATELGLDQDLLAREELQLPAIDLALDNIAGWSRAIALYQLTREHEFFSQGGLVAPAKQCAEIAEMVRRAPETTIFLRLGWGIGWRSMTGGVLSVSEIRTLIENHGNRITKHPDSATIFPKSRKVMLDSANRPAGVFGWIRLDAK